MNPGRFRPFAILVLLHALVLLLTVVFLAKQRKIPTAGRDRIVVIPIEGIISSSNKSISAPSIDDLVKTLTALADRDEVKAVVLRINSPGGSVGAVQEVYRAVEHLRAKGKKVVASFNDVAASGGYYVACASDRIVSNPGTLTGSIGVIMERPSVKGLLDKVGVEMDVIKSGAMKDIGSPFRAMTPEERDFLQKLILDSYDQFFAAVKEGRKLDDAALKPLADGRVFTGRMALQNKLVDELGGLPEAIEAAKKLAGLQDKHPVIVYHREKTGLQKVLGVMGKTPVSELQDWTHTETRLMYLMQ